MFGGDDGSESVKSRSSATLTREPEMCVAKTDFERADLAKKRVAFLLQTKTKFG